MNNTHLNLTRDLPRAVSSCVIGLDAGLRLLGGLCPGGLSEPLDGRGGGLLGLRVAGRGTAEGEEIRQRYQEIVNELLNEFGSLREDT